MARALMFQGTGSDVGKSLIVAGVCRALTRRGLTVRPFKPQNMSNNAAVTPSGSEIGRAQALQARACGVEPCADMNPVLLKPQSEVGAQVVVQGKVLGNYQARDYHGLKPQLLDAVLDSFGRLRAGADVVIVEGAGSPAEVNLRDGDIANMGFAQAANVPVVIVGNIERGGVIASLIGTVALLTEAERALARGFIVNRFRGDKSLFDDGVRIIAERTNLPCFGVIPHIEEAKALPPEDSMALRARDGTGGGQIKIAVPKLLHIANFDDFDPLMAEPGATVQFIDGGTALPGDADLVILPGTKTTLAALAHFRDQGWDIDLHAHARRGGHVLGICGGYQMLGSSVADPDAVEGSAGKAAGLALLDVETTIGAEKSLRPVEGTAVSGGATVRGYEMHMGRTTGTGTSRPFLQLGERLDGAVSADGRVAGCYLHGLFTSDAFRGAYLRQIAGAADSGLRFEAHVDAALDAVADGLEHSLDIDALLAAAA